jgi:hypothetical protein
VEVAVERRVLQWIVALASIVPIFAGSAGILRGPAFLTEVSGGDRDVGSHFRYLSGLLLGIGFAYLFSVRDIERRRERFLLLGAIVVVGGFSRLGGALTNGVPSAGMMFGLMMELLVTPALTLWQLRISRQMRDETIDRSPNSRLD